jgi:hypothetical protein
MSQQSVTFGVDFYTSFEGSHRMTAWANAAVNSGGSEKFQGDVFMLSSWCYF